MGRRREDDLVRDLGARLRTRRHAAGLTQEALASGAGLKPETISRIETGRACPDLPTLRRLLAVLDASFGDVLDPLDQRAPLSRPEARLLAVWRGLDGRRRRLVLDVAESMAGVEQVMLVADAPVDADEP